MGDDRRVRRTRAALLRALLELMVEKGYDAITVADLIERADVGRSTFYAHFTDKSDLLDESLAGLRAGLTGSRGTDRAGDQDVVEGPSADRSRPLPFSARLFDHVAEQRDLLTSLLGHPGSGAVVERIEHLLRDVARRDLAPLAAAAGPRARVPVDVVARAVVAGLMAVLVWWAEEGGTASAGTLEDMFRTLVAPGVRAALPPAAG